MMRSQHCHQQGQGIRTQAIDSNTNRTHRGITGAEMQLQGSTDCLVT